MLLSITFKQVYYWTTQCLCRKKRKKIVGVFCLRFASSFWQHVKEETVLISWHPERWRDMPVHLSFELYCFLFRLEFRFSPREYTVFCSFVHTLFTSSLSLSPFTNFVWQYVYYKAQTCNIISSFRFHCFFLLSNCYNYLKFAVWLGNIQGLIQNMCQESRDFRRPDFGGSKFMYFFF